MTHGQTGIACAARQASALHTCRRTALGLFCCCIMRCSLPLQARSSAESNAQRSGCSHICDMSGLQGCAWDLPVDSVALARRCLLRRHQVSGTANNGSGRQRPRCSSTTTGAPRPRAYRVHGRRALGCAACECGCSACSMRLRAVRSCVCRMRSVNRFVGRVCVRCTCAPHIGTRSACHRPSAARLRSAMQAQPSAVPQEFCNAPSPAMAKRGPPTLHHQQR